MRTGSFQCSCAVAFEGRRGQAYNEVAFRYFLELERTRSKRSGRPSLVLLVDLREGLGGDAHIDRAVARRLFSSLWLSLRETDFVGWYREDHAVGAVLTGLDAGPRAEVARLVGQRVSEVLRERLPSDVAGRFRVRVGQPAESERYAVRARFDWFIEPGDPSREAELHPGEI